MATRILIVDDEKLIVQILKDTLSMKGFDVVGFAYDGDSAVKKYFEISPRPDLVIMDHRMPVKNGVEAMEEILATDPSAKILFLSADSRIKDIAMARGAVGFLSKPFEGVELLRAMRNAIKEERDKPPASASVPKAVSSLFKQGYELGVEVGYYGHMETAGWVNSKKRELQSLAEGLGVQHEFNQEYERGREDGRHRRVKPESLRREDHGEGHQTSGGGGTGARAAESATFGGGGVVSKESEQRQSRTREPHIVQADLQSVATMFEQYRGSSIKVLQEIYSMIESMVPVRFDDIPGRGREMIDRGMQALIRSGWITFYSVDAIDVSGGQLTISLESAFARCSRRFDHTICRFLEPILSDLVTRAFGRRVIMRETSCIAAGSEVCTFSSI